MKLWFDNNGKIFKIDFQGEDLYDLKQAIDNELRYDVDIKPCKDIDAFSEDTLISELLEMFPNSYEKRWILEPKGTCIFKLSSFKLQLNSLKEYTIQDVQKWFQNQEFDSLKQDLQKVKLVTLIYVFQQLLYFKGFSLFSISSGLLIGNFYGYWHSKRNPTTNDHFLKSCFVHTDINQFLLNISSLLVFLPVVEYKVGATLTLLGYFFGSYFYKKQLKKQGKDTMGATGAVVLLSASRMRFDFASVMERVLYYFAMEESFKTRPHLMLMILGKIAL